MSDNEAMADQYDSDADDFNPSAHKKLIAGLNRLQKSQFIKKASRNEPALKRDEFNLVKPSSSIDAADAGTKRNKVDVNDLVSVLDKTNKHLQLGKVLRKTADKKKVLPVPLQKPAAEKLQRAINYEKTKEKLERWDAVVTKNRSADHLVNTNEKVCFNEKLISVVCSFLSLVIPVESRAIEYQSQGFRTNAFEVSHQIGNDA